MLAMISLRRLLTPNSRRLVVDQISMRWKLLVLSSLAAALVAFGLWSALAIGLFGTATGLARHDWLLFVSAIVPLAIAAYAGVFVYRHTARRRKTQAVFTVMLSLVFTLGTYLVASQLFPDTLIIRRTY
jgi:cytochrome bd-type quinol oxidase subunit 2